MEPDGTLPTSAGSAHRCRTPEAAAGARDRPAQVLGRMEMGKMGEESEGFQCFHVSIKSFEVARQGSWGNKQARFLQETAQGF